MHIESFQGSISSWDTVFEKTAHENFSRGKKNVRCTMDDLLEELLMHRAGKGRGRCLTLCYETLLGIPPTSVQPERDFSIVKSLLGDKRGKIGSKTLDDIFLLKRVFHFKAM